MENDVGGVGDVGGSGDVGGFGDYGGADYGGHAGDGVGEVGSVSDGGSAGSIADAAPAGQSYGKGLDGGLLGTELGGVGAPGTDSFGNRGADPADSNPAGVGFFGRLQDNFSGKGLARAALGGPAAVGMSIAGTVIGAIVDTAKDSFSSSAATGFSSSGTFGSADNYGGGGDVLSTSFGGSGGGVVYGVGGSPVIGYTQPKPAPLVSPVYTKTAAPSIQTPAASKQSSGIGALLLTLGLVYLGLS